MKKQNPFKGFLRRPYWHQFVPMSCEYLNKHARRRRDPKLNVREWIEFLTANDGDLAAFLSDLCDGSIFRWLIKDIGGPSQQVVLPWWQLVPEILMIDREAPKDDSVFTVMLNFERGADPNVPIEVECYLCDSDGEYMGMEVQAEDPQTAVIMAMGKMVEREPEKAPTPILSASTSLTVLEDGEYRPIASVSEVKINIDAKTDPTELKAPYISFACQADQKAMSELIGSLQFTMPDQDRGLTIRELITSDTLNAIGRPITFDYIENGEPHKLEGIVSNADPLTADGKMNIYVTAVTLDGKPVPEFSELWPSVIAQGRRGDLSIAPTPRLIEEGNTNEDAN